MIDWSPTPADFLERATRACSDLYAALRQSGAVRQGRSVMLGKWGTTATTVTACLICLFARPLRVSRLAASGVEGG